MRDCVPGRTSHRVQLLYFKGATPSPDTAPTLTSGLFDRYIYFTTNNNNNFYLYKTVDFNRYTCSVVLYKE